MAEQLGKRLKRWRRPIFVLVALGVTLIAGSDFAQRFKFFYAVEESTVDLRFALRGAEDPAEDRVPIRIVKIDDRSLYPQLSEADLAANPQARYLMEGWPWNRAVHARVAERLIEAGARCVVFDLVFPGPNEGDFDLLDAIDANPGKIVIGFDYVVDKSALGETFVSERLPYDDLLPVEIDNLLGFVNIVRDQDGALRRAKLSTNVYLENLPFTGDPERRAKLEQAGQITGLEYSLGARAALAIEPGLVDRIPPPGHFPHINYGSASHFLSANYLDVLVDDRFANQKQLFDGALVFVGAYSDFFKDVVTSPFGDVYGVEAQAHTARSLINQSFYKQVDGPIRWLILASVAILLLAGTIVFHQATSKGLYIIGLLLGYLLLAQGLFISPRYIVPVVPALWIILLPGGLFLIYDYTISQYEKRRLQDYLGRYVSEEIASLIGADSDRLDAVLRGANRPIVALFADIRNFTSISEKISPEQLVAQLNEYFEEMISIIHRHRGSLNKYIGDAVLAVWGGIHSEGSARDCENAVRASLEMCDALKGLNASWSQADDRVPLQIGIGLSFGDGFVGNMGHSKRMEFAVMGDIVNLASRLEGATKLYDGPILVNESLARQCSDTILFQEVDRLQVKGKDKSVPVFFAIKPKDGSTEPEWLAPWKKARELYLNRDFAAAEQAFAALGKAFPEQSENARMYQSRCQTYQKQPPPEDWDGTFKMETK